MTQQYMAVDQYGNHYYGLVHPRKDLLERLDRKHANKMYMDYKDGSYKHVGYVIAGLWLDVYKIERFKS